MCVRWGVLNIFMCSAPESPTNYQSGTSSTRPSSIICLDKVVMYCLHKQTHSQVEMQGGHKNMLRENEIG